MLCNNWLIATDEHRVKIVGKRTDTIETAIANSGGFVKTGLAVVDFRRCTGVIKVYFDENYKGKQDGCNPQIIYQCNVCHGVSTDPKLPGIEELVEAQQRWLDSHA